LIDAIENLSQQMKTDKNINQDNDDKIFDVFIIEVAILGTEIDESCYREKKHEDKNNIKLARQSVLIHPLL